MGSTTQRITRLAALTSVVLLIVSPTWAAGFGIFEQGTKAMGEAMAFTAQADDPSAMFYNVGGLGLFDEREFYAGLTFISLGESEFRGAAPFPGPDQTGTQSDHIAIPPHFYWVEPVGERLNFGFSVTSPFGLSTEWDDPDRWSGRFINVKAELATLDFTPNVGFRVNDHLGVGFGVVVRTADVELRNRLAAVDPFDGMAKEVGRVKLTSDTDTGVGFNLGILHRVGDFFSWGFSYRSAITVDFSGDGYFTQEPTGNPVFDALVAAQIPFDQNLPISTSIEFPDQASLGVGMRFNPRWLWEVDFNWTGWSSFDKIEIDFKTDPSLDQTRPQNWDDAINVRTGVVWTRSKRSSWRFGVYYDETPQPQESVSPLLPDADRVGYSVGYGLDAENFDFDIAMLYVDFDDRTVTYPNSNDFFFGTYRTRTVLLGMSVGW